MWSATSTGSSRIEVEEFSPVLVAFVRFELAFVDGTTGAIVMDAVAGAGTRHRATGGQSRPSHIAVDGAAVYWEAGGMIARLPKGGAQAMHPRPLARVPSMR